MVCCQRGRAARHGCAGPPAASPQGRADSASSSAISMARPSASTILAAAGRGPRGANDRRDRDEYVLGVGGGEPGIRRRPDRHQVRRHRDVDRRQGGQPDEHQCARVQFGPGQRRRIDVDNVLQHGGISNGHSESPSVRVNIGLSRPSLPVTDPRHIPVRARGTANALALWFSAELAPGISLSVGPGDPPTHWGMTTAPLRWPVQLTPGMVVRARVRTALARPIGTWTSWAAALPGAGPGEPVPRSRELGLPEGLRSGFHPHCSTTRSSARGRPVLAPASGSVHRSSAT